MNKMTIANTSFCQ